MFDSGGFAHAAAGSFTHTILYHNMARQLGSSSMVCHGWVAEKISSGQVLELVHLRHTLGPSGPLLGNVTDPMSEYSYKRYETEVPLLSCLE